MKEIIGNIKKIIPTTCNYHKTCASGRETISFLNNCFRIILGTMRNNFLSLLAEMSVLGVMK